MSVAPVSYTHLDVYKRQSLDGEEIWTQDLMQNLLEEKQESSKDDKDLVTTEQAVEENSEGSTVDSGSGTVTCRMRCV